MLMPILLSHLQAANVARYNALESQMAEVASIEQFMIATNGSFKGFREYGGHFEFVLDMSNVEFCDVASLVSLLHQSGYDRPTRLPDGTMFTQHVSGNLLTLAGLKLPG